MDISQFVSSFRKHVKPQIIDIFRQFETAVEAKTNDFNIPTGDTQKHKFIHGKIFEDSICQAAKNCMPDKKLLEEFQTLYPEFCARSSNFERYLVGMKEAGLLAWNLVHFMQSQTKSYTFGQKIRNEHFKALRPNLLLDFIQPALIYDFKFSTLKSQEEYEQKYLVNGLVQVLTYYLCMGIAPAYARLGILVYYASLNKVVFYSSNLHKDGFCVNFLKEKLNEQQELNYEGMPPLEGSYGCEGMSPLKPSLTLQEKYEKYQYYERGGHFGGMPPLETSDDDPSLNSDSLPDMGRLTL